MDQPVLAGERGGRQLFPAPTPPSMVAMRPQASHDPAVKPVEEPSDVGTLIIPPPPRKTGFNASITGAVVRGTFRLVS